MSTSQAIKSKNVGYTHFVSLPLTLPDEMVTKLNNFKNSALQTNKGLGIDKSIFIKPNTLHLTVQMLKLWNTDRIEAAADVLRRVSPKVMDALERRPVYIRLKGLECMPDRAFLGVIIDAFIEAGLVLEKDANRGLLLHATLMNAGHSKSSKTSGKTEPFDARTIFAQYGSEEWGECYIREAHLSQRFVYDGNGYFHCCASIPFPEEKQGAFPMMKNFFQKMFSTAK
ncbi:activating signal cointegrator 1 complex subunit 1-like isoform X4 [Solanum tuberosum]|uniref:activating signal cointegrator 1 complex subunit 1-like isoform X4 n=1 Tax=Solanum tuberosum TaxID=4113 RepID=UPI0003D29D9A|nr:PREDICTED: activating signal cointegrator 1 complex subunit 1-like isoform X4 [Solanum tuberosum]